MTLHLDLTGVKGSKMDADVWLWKDGMTGQTYVLGSVYRAGDLHRAGRCGGLLICRAAARGSAISRPAKALACGAAG